jgi:hypothetical protein
MARDAAAHPAATALGVGLAQAQDSGQEHDKPGSSPSADPALLRELEQMEERIRALENQLRQTTPATLPAPAGGPPRRRRRMGSPPRTGTKSEAR